MNLEQQYKDIKNKMFPGYFVEKEGIREECPALFEPWVLLFIGPSNKGPFREVVKVTDVVSARELFGEDSVLTKVVESYFVNTCDMERAANWCCAVNLGWFYSCKDIINVIESVKGVVSEVFVLSGRQLWLERDIEDLIDYQNKNSIYIRFEEDEGGE